ncbi:hypothetical protein F5882DRAFT_431992 [Hyaloscypha sp. PMI_1271]|nr:hypothetical protein F5882DRAFT_431992 [Hyaloscypha sp. PMI_1271]
MSGAKASLIISLIGSIITIIETTYQVYEAIEDEKGLPANFKKAASKLPLISKILSNAEKYPTLKSCKLQATRLRDIFTKVMLDEDDSRWDRYVKAARIIGKGGHIEDLARRILDNLQLMSTNFPEVEVSKIEPSLPDSFEEAPVFAHYGSGAQNVNIGGGS